MKANYQKLPLDLRSELFMSFWVRSNLFGFHWHYHPEIEICYVKQGYGQRLVGESIERFEAGDFVVVGSNLPHCWISDEQFNQSSLQMEMYVIHIDIKKIAPLLSIHEFKNIHHFLEAARVGFSFDVETEPNLLKVLQSFEQKKGVYQSLELLHLLHQLSTSISKKQLCTSTYIPETGKQVEERILKICQYIHNHYKEKITLETLGRITNMNETAFCRFFKKVIGKTAMEYINELRINAASNELMISDKSINEIAYENGFSSLSHFNKLFKQYNQQTPSKYRKIYRQK